MALSTIEILRNLAHEDDTFKELYINAKNGSYSCLRTLFDTLCSHPNVITRMLVYVRLQTQFCPQLSQYITASTTIDVIYAPHNLFSFNGYFMIAKSLQINSSLRVLIIHGAVSVNRTNVARAFINALRLNPTRPEGSNWELFNPTTNCFVFLKLAADKSPPPSMLEFLLCVH
jgi:hypothetical protein